ncbi:MAG: DUF1634 domain-containing protein [Edaphocola sp.]
MASFKEKDLQLFIGNLLRIGVIIAMTVVIVGLAVYLFAGGNSTADYSHFDAAHRFQPHLFMEQLRTGNSKAIMELGVMLLIATPIARVLFTMIGFWLEKDYQYTVIALLVLLVIICSLLLGIAH